MINSSLPGQPFDVATPQAVLDDLNDRLRRTRFPAQQITGDWSYGTPLDYASRLRDRWMGEFDWRYWERRLNQFEQRMLTVGDNKVHVVLEQGSGNDPLPLLLTHGWPGSVLEFIDMIEPLAHPERFGGRIEDAFTVVAPSLPGFGYSPAPAAPISPMEIARLWSRIATEQFNFKKYAAHGGDWGSVVTANLALFFPDRLVGIHLNTVGMTPTMDETSPPLTQAEAAWAVRMQSILDAESGYQQIQATKPQSLAYAQTDSPLGLACWIIEKFQAWTIPGESGDPPFNMDWLIANVMLYWINGSNVPSWMYTFLRNRDALSAPKGMRVQTPSAFTLFPNDLIAPAPKEWAERVFNVQHYRLAEHGGHFPARENSDMIIKDIRDFMAKYR